MFNLYSLLDLIRARPGMYLGEPSLTRLWHFLIGYKTALVTHGIAYEQTALWRPYSRELPDFHTFVARHFKEGASAEGYATRILRHTNGDERAALELFWGLLDEYRALEQELENRLLPN